VKPISKASRVGIVRGACNLSVEQLSEAVGVSVQTIKYIESGRYDVTPSLAEKAGSVFGVSPRWMLGEGSDNPIIMMDGNSITPKELHSRARWIRQGKSTLVEAKAPLAAYALREVTKIRNSLLGPISAAFADGRHMAILHDCRQFVAKMRKKYGDGDGLRHKMQSPFERLPENPRHAGDLLAYFAQCERDDVQHQWGEVWQMIAQIKAINDKLQTELAATSARPKNKPRKGRTKK
jgi:DNA-binding XRE family transcriptional regulator